MKREYLRRRCLALKMMLAKGPEGLQVPPVLKMILAKSRSPVVCLTAP